MMTDRELRKLNRTELLELLLEKSRENERLRTQLEEAKEQLADRAASQYLENVRRITEGRRSEDEA